MRLQRLLFIIAFTTITFLSCCSVTNNQTRVTKPYESVILLDFDGYKPLEQAWSVDSFNAAGYSDSIQLKVLAEVQQYYKQFNVLITRDEKEYAKFAQWKRYRAIISTTRIYYGSSYPQIGLAIYNIHYKRDTTAAYISARGYTGSHIGVSTVIAHEVGHMIGLLHQADWTKAVKNREYSIGTGKTAPIMGNPSDADTATWVIGTNDVGQFQDDTLILVNQLGRR